MLDRTLILSVMWTSVGAEQQHSADLYAGDRVRSDQPLLPSKPTQDLTLNFSVENLLNQYYRPYAIPVGSSTDGTTQNDVKWASAGPGLVVKGGLKISFWWS